jgi:hypothetical protein
MAAELKMALKTIFQFKISNSVTGRASDNGFKISPEKTKIMLMHRRRPRHEGNTRFKLRVGRDGQETSNIGTDVQ